MAYHERALRTGFLRQAQDFMSRISMIRTPFDELMASNSTTEKVSLMACHERGRKILGEIFRTSRMVEAAGVEPASGNTPLKVLHAYPVF